MGKPTDNINAQEEFTKLEIVLNETADETSKCIKLLKQQLSDYDKRNGNHMINTASSYMRSDLRTVKDTAMEMKHVAHEIHKSHKPSKTEVSSARNMMDVTAKAVENLKMRARNYDKENKQKMGVKGTIDAAVGGHHDKEKHKDHHEKEKYHENHGGLFGKDDKDHKHEGGLFEKDDKDQKHEGGLFENNHDEEHRGGLFGKSEDNNGNGIMGSTDTVETIVKKTLRDNFSLNTLDHQITAAEKSLSPSIAERAKEKMHEAKEKMYEVKDKLKGDKHESTHTHHEDHPMMTP